MITQERLHQLIDYDPQTGIFRAKVRRSSSKAGALGCIADRGKRIKYLRIVIERRHYYAHRLAWFYVHGRWPKLLDHRNGDGTDNRIENLREATHSGNHANTRLRADNKTGFKGVSQSRSGRWYATIRKDGKTKALGTYSTPEEAHAAYVDAARRLFGSFHHAGDGG